MGKLFALSHLHLQLDENNKYNELWSLSKHEYNTYKLLVFARKLHTWGSHLIIWTCKVRVLRWLLLCCQRTHTWLLSCLLKNTLLAIDEPTNTQGVTHARQIIDTDVGRLSLNLLGVGCYIIKRWMAWERAWNTRGKSSSHAHTS